MEYRGKNIFVAGAARSGVSVSKLLAGLGASVTLYDIKDGGPAYKELQATGVKCVFGENPSDFDNVDILVISPGIPADLPFITSAREGGVNVIGEVEAAFTLCESPVVAITGTNGKTTVTSLAGGIIAKYRPGSVTCGNIGKPFSDYAKTLPEEAFAVIEVSSFQLETTKTFAPAVSAILNITPDHLNRHKTMENYARIKSMVFANQSSDGYAVLNADDPITAALAEGDGKPACRVIWFSRQKEVNGAFLKDGAICVNLGGETDELAKISELRIFGGHNIENALAAAAICRAAGVPADVIGGGLKSFAGVEHRIEFTRELDGVKYYNDSKATNPDSAIKAIEALVSVRTGQERPGILLIAGGRDKASDYSGFVSLFDANVKLCVTVGEAAPIIERVCRERGFNPYMRVNSMRDAVELCRARAAAGDLVLLSPACASFDMFDNYEQRGEVFKKCVMDLS